MDEWIVNTRHTKDFSIRQLWYLMTGVGLGRPPPGPVIPAKKNVFKMVLLLLHLKKNKKKKSIELYSSFNFWNYLNRKKDISILEPGAIEVADGAHSRANIPTPAKFKKLLAQGVSADQQFVGIKTSGQTVDRWIDISVGQIMSTESWRMLNTNPEHDLTRLEGRDGSLGTISSYRIIINNK